MKKISFLLITTMLLLLSACSQQSSPSQPPAVHTSTAVEAIKHPIFKAYSLKELQEDFDQVRDTIMTRNPLVFANKDKLNRLFDQQRLLLKDQMEELDFYRVVMPIIAQVKCGHSGLYFSDAYSSFDSQQPYYLPLAIATLGNQSFINHSLPGDSIPAGAEILSINGKTMTEIVPKLLSFMTADGNNQTRKYYILNHSFSAVYADNMEHATSFEITYRVPGGDEVLSTKITGVSRAQLNQRLQTPQAVPYRADFPSDTYAVLTVKSFAFYDSKGRGQFEKFLDDFFKKAKEQGMANLILDLRDNWGGDPLCSSYLFSYLAQKEVPYFSNDTPYYSNLEQPLKLKKNHFEGKLYVLINGASFSSTGHLCSLLSYYKRGTFIGQETGGSFVCTDGSKDLVLKNTKMKLHYSTETFRTAVENMVLGQGILPDYPIEPTIDDLLAGKDMEMAKALELIGQK